MATPFSLRRDLRGAGRWTAWASAAATVLWAAGCTPGGFSKKQAVGGELQFRYAMHASPTTLDPGKVQDVDTSDLLQNIYQGLVAYDDKNEIVPVLAESWTVEDGGKRYRFRLRGGLKFHSGRAVKASDVVYSLNRHVDPKFGSPTAGYLSDIVGYADVLAGKATVLKGLSAPNDSEVVIDLDAPRPYFLGKLTYPCAFVVNPERAKGEITVETRADGTGPYRLRAYAKDQEVLLEAFDGTVGGRPPTGVLVRPIIKDAATRLLKYRNGELDILTLERQDMAAVEKDAKLRADVVEVPRPVIYYLGMNQARFAPFRDARVRRAFMLGINRKKIAEDVIGLPYAKGFVPPGVTGHRADLAGVPFDPSAARRLLAEAGYPEGHNFPALTITYREGRPDSQLLAVSAVTDLKKNLGINVSARAMEWRSFLEARNAKQLQFVGLSWYADYLDPENFLSFLMRSDASENRDGYANPEFDALCRQADVEMDPSKRTSLYHQAEDILLEDAARIPVYYGRDILLVSPRVSGLRTNLFGTMPHATVTVSARNGSGAGSDGSEKP
ncbi:MAG: peptide ABC transporter substrate-binding protein [Fimbriimonadaceae bacterium]|nr:peptide ABC transporter substrate-binding protein [Fimbriimonadaceae bacterium]